MKIIALIAVAIFGLSPAAVAQTGAGGTGSAETSPMPDTNAGGPVGSTAVPRGNNPSTTQTSPNRPGSSSGHECETMPGTSAQKPAQGGSDNPQPQEHCQ